MAEAWGMVLYICPSISHSWGTMGAKSSRRVFTDFSKMAQTDCGGERDNVSGGGGRPLQHRIVGGLGLEGTSGGRLAQRP